MHVDTILLVFLPLAFATLVTVHVALFAGFLARRQPRRALVAFVLPPLAPFWGARLGMHRRSVLWVVAGVAYVALRIAARR